jgi:hypothetical protein
VNLRKKFMRITVKQLANMWRAAAESEDGSSPDKAAQLRACAKDLEQVHFSHELVAENPVSGKSIWWRKIL